MRKLSTLMTLLLLAVLSGQGIAAQTPYRYFPLGRPWDTWTSRLTLSTSLTDWALMTPNVGIDVDLFDPSRIKAQSVYLGLRAGADSQYRLWRYDYEGAHLGTLAAQLQYRWHFSLHRHPELYRGRWFAGPYAEGVTEWKASSLGAIAGYDLPMVSFSNKHFLEAQLSAQGGVNLRGHLLGELHLALTYRTTSIASKYWQPNAARYDQHRAYNLLCIDQMDSLKEVIDREPVTIYAASLRGDSALAHPVTLETVRQAFARQYRSPWLVTSRLEEMPDNTPLPIMQPTEHNNVLYRMELLKEDYDGEAGEHTFVLPFRVRIEGYEAAQDRMLSYNRALRKAFDDSQKRLPSLMLPPISAEEMAEPATREQIVALLNERWPDGNLRPDEIAGYYVRQDGEFEPTTLDQMNRRGTYAVSLRFHPQVSEDCDSLTTRFNILPLIADRDQEMYDRFRELYNQRQIYVYQPWHNGHEEPVTKHQLIMAMDRVGLTGYTEDQLQVTDSIHYGRNIVTATFGRALPEQLFNFVVEDSLGLQMGTLMHHALSVGHDSKRALWNYKYAGNDAHGPLVDGRYDDDGNLVVADRQALLDAVSGYLISIDPSLSGLIIEQTWVTDYQNTGLHPLRTSKDSPEGTQWTILQFRYRLLYEGSARIATANVAYRIRKPQ